MPMPMIWDDVRQTIDTIESLSTSEEIFNTLREFVSRAGGSSLLIGQVMNPVITGKALDNYGWSDWPAEYLDEWVKNDYVIHDPITHLATRATGPFEWSEAYEKGTEFGRKILDRAKNFGLDTGFSIPIRTGYLPLGIVSIGYKVRISESNVEPLELASIHAYTRSQVLSQITVETNQPLLTKREVDVLTFTAAGKTSWEISMILGIADTTVKSHIRNIILKMGTTNKTQAVIKGVQSGQIIL